MCVTLEIEGEDCDSSQEVGGGGGAAFWRWPQSSVQCFGAKFNFLPCKKKRQKKKTRLSFAWALVKEVSRVLRWKQGKSAVTSLGKPVSCSCGWSPIWDPVPWQRWIFMSHVCVSPKLSGGSSRLLLPLAGGHAVRVFSPAGTQNICSLLLMERFLLTTKLAWWCCCFSPTTDVKWAWAQASADLMLRPSDRDRVKTSPPRIHSTDPDQPMKRAAPSSNLLTRGLRWGASGLRLSSPFDFS